MRKIRTKTQQASAEGKKQKVAVEKKVRTAADLLKESKKAVAKTVKSMTQAELHVLIDAGTELDVMKKKCEARVKEIKKLVLQHAEHKKWKQVATGKSSALISPGTSTTIEPTVLAKYLKKIKRSKLMQKLISVKVGEVKKALGADVVEELGDIDCKEFGSVTLRKIE